ncbi:hypothetical protein [Deinococcus sp. YIM 77859]|uniref:hypothetical protein n=1 Tax=Deinococcus sp. YIM 77859 TaxID=1540221 RepID=UPI00054FBCF2|nr:hypothetical protein [Deinococcus sp. YIM 77859]
MRCVRWAALLLLLGAAAARPPVAAVNLRPSFGGAVLEGHITAGAGDELTGVWSAGGRARLLKCTPRCTAVQAIPLSGTLRLGTETPYRIAVSGDFRTGQHVKLALRFGNLRVLNIEATVLRAQ